jgi:hypothetical protein
MRLDALSFVILLAAAMRSPNPNFDRFSLQIIHELHAHADGKYDWLDFDDLKGIEETRDLDEPYLRFALASVGIKRARGMYRMEGQQRAELPFQKKDDVATQSKSLLYSIETFAKEQIHYRPESPVGFWNLGGLLHRLSITANIRGKQQLNFTTKWPILASYLKKRMMISTVQRQEWNWPWVLCWEGSQLLDTLSRVGKKSRSYATLTLYGAMMEVLSVFLLVRQRQLALKKLLPRRRNACEIR